MRKIIIALLCCTLLVGCSKTGNTTFVENSSAPAIPAPTPTSTAKASTATSGSGQPAGSAIDDIIGTKEETENPLPTPTGGFVNDYAKVVDKKTKAELEATLARLKETSKIEFAIAILETTGTHSSEDYALALARRWRVGLKEGSGGGILLMIAVKDRKWEIRWTRRLEETLKTGTGAELKRQMTEPFRQGKYGEGLLKGVEAVIAKLPGQPPLSANGKTR